MALERAAQEKAAMEKALAEREERARAAATPRRASAAATASPAESGDSGPPLYMPVQHRPGDHGSVPSVSPPLTQDYIFATTSPSLRHSAQHPTLQSGVVHLHRACLKTSKRNVCLLAADRNIAHV